MAFVHAVPHVEGELVGREAELAAIADRLRGGAPILLLGPPGVGKTSLAIRAIEAVSPPSSEVFDASDVVRVSDVRGLLSRCPLAPDDSPVASRPVVLFDGLDAAEPEAWRALREWLAGAPVRAVLTARGRPDLTPFDIAVAFVAPLEVPPPSASASAILASPAVELLLAEGRGPELAKLRSMAAGRRAVDDALVGRVAALAQALDGLPLSLRLAGSTLEVLPIADLLQHLERGAGILRPAGRTERGLAHLIRDAWSGLSEGARRAMRRCAVFAGPFDLDAAQRVVDDAPEATVHALHEAIRAGLLSRHARDDELLVMLRAVRVLVEAELEDDERAQALDRHTALFLARIGELESVDIETQGRRVVGVQRALGDLWTAAARALAAGQVERALRLLGPAVMNQTGRTPSAVDRALVQTALSAATRLEPRSPAESFLLAAMAELDRTVGLIDRAIEASRRAAEVAEQAGSRGAQKGALAALGSCLTQAGMHAEAIRVTERAAALASDLEDRPHAALLRGNIAHLMLGLGELDEAVSALHAALDDARGAGSDRMVAFLVEYLAYAELLRERPTQARPWIDEAIRRHEALGSHRRLVLLRGLSAECDELQGHIDRARAGFVQAAAAFEALDDRRMASLYRCLLARVEIQRGQLRAARASLDAARAHERDWDSELRALVPATTAVLAMVEGDAGDAAAHASAATVGRPLDAWVVAVAAIARDVAALSDAPRAALAEGLSALDARLRDVGHSGAPLVRVVSDAIARRARAVARIWVAADGAYVETVDGCRHPLTPYARAQALLRHLADRRLRTPGAPCSLDALFEAAWPGEHIKASAASNRVYVALSQIRKAGLADALERDEGGWWLEPDTVEVVAPSVTPSGR